MGRSKPKIVRAHYRNTTVSALVKNEGDTNTIYVGVVDLPGETNEIRVKDKLKAGEQKDYELYRTVEKVRLFVTNDKGVTTDKIDLTRKPKPPIPPVIPKPPTPPPVEKRISGYIEDVDYPKEAKTGDDLKITCRVWNNGDVPHNFGIGCSMRDEKGKIIDLPLISKFIGVDKRKTARWTWKLYEAGKYDITFVVWEESAPPLKTRLDTVKWIEDAITIEKIEIPPHATLLEQILLYLFGEVGKEFLEGVGWKTYVSILDRIVDLFGITLPDGRKVILIVAADVKWLPNVGAELADDIAKGAMDTAARRLLSNFRANPTGTMKALAKLTQDKLNRLFGVLPKYPMGKEFINIYARELAKGTFTKIGILGKLLSPPKGVMIWLGAIAGLIGFGAFSSWFAKELPEPSSFAVWSLIEAGMWEEAKKANEVFKEFIGKAKTLIDTLGWLSPFTKAYFDEVNEAQRLQAEEWDKLIEEKLVVPPPPPPPPVPGTIIDIWTDPTDVEVHIPGLPVETSGPDGRVDISVVPGTYDITFKKEGYLDETKTIFIKEGETKALSITLTPKPVIPPPPPPEMGTLRVESVPSARIFIGGKDTGEMTPAEFELTPGTYDIRLEKAGYKTEEAMAFIKAGVVTTISKELTEEIVVPPPPPPPPPEKKFKVIVESDPSNADIYVDDKYTYKRTPDYVILYEGHYTISIRKMNYFPAEVGIDLV